MQWFYAFNNEQRGPVDDSELAELAARGIVQGNSLIWREGMGDWQPYDTVMTRQAAAPRLSPAPDTAPVLDHGIQGRPCVECGGHFPPENMLQYQGQWICAACKPLYFERLREGVPAAGQYRYAGFWIRFCAKFVDGLIFLVLFVAISFLPASSSSTSMDGAPSPSAAILLLLVQWVFPLCYSVFFLGKFGATPGKMACGLRVIRSDGQKVTYLRALGRHFAEFISMIILYVGYIMAGFDSQQHRALHDYICDTRVIYK